MTQKATSTKGYLSDEHAKEISEVITDLLRIVEGKSGVRLYPEDARIVRAKRMLRSLW